MKIIPFFPLFLIFSLMHPAGIGAGGLEFPPWIHELHSIAARTFQTSVSTSPVKMLDRLEEGRFFMFCLKGHGSLKEIPDPFETMERMFSTNGWTYVPRYQADGHGSSSFAYEKGDRFCNIHVNTDSSCDDEEMDHVPSEFWFEILCRENQRSSEEKH